MDDLDSAILDWIDTHSEEEKSKDYLIQGHHSYTLKDIKNALHGYQPLWLELRMGLIKLTIELLVKKKIKLPEKK